MNEMRKLMESIEKINEDNFEISPSIKKYFKDYGMYVKVQSVWSGKISKAIAVEPATRGDKYAAKADNDWDRILPILTQFAKENGLDAEVYRSEYGGRRIIEYRT